MTNAERALRAKIVERLKQGAAASLGCCEEVTANPLFTPQLRAEVDEWFAGVAGQFGVRPSPEERDAEIDAQVDKLRA